MKVLADKAAIDRLNEILEQYTDKPKTIRLYIAGMGWGGPSFGLALDEQKENDILDESTGVKFIIEKDLYDQFGDFSIQSVGQGFRVSPASSSDDDACGGCSGC